MRKRDALCRASYSLSLPFYDKLVLFSILSVLTAQIIIKAR